ncbi:biotin--[acetyl-CoA-carboxylase] ligase [Nesterenkonia sp. E16_7]|uniref:biotin--[acetyl-CoA-carboxylase] ligase n=1 Tax=unclassified Nesterenkonia TaxID=2629769 RepID=UPI001A924E54|nr:MULTISPECIES: biotin--[acetyl-CoA-carboxylase] ligase [unclassified Nesterenkonia]MBO0594117.1 biotin--[acetyl-CoA-carboxylase] ligase [Nesterenkonia sp. E16_10]MBO0597563.1 biotin--[acetyl-CoA-carboxylase] ligase [Nesterenkonia sp. E16_7]
MTAALPPLDDALLARRLLSEAGGAYARIQRVESVGSTNEWLTRALAAETQAQPGSHSDTPPRRQVPTAWPHLSVLTAEEQTGGRGRLGRAWSSPKGASLSTSIVLRPQLAAEHLGWLSMLAGRALVDTLRQDFGLDAADQRAVLKWPNDVQVTQTEGPEKKISGILASAVPGRPAAPGTVVLGVGINVLLTPEQLPIEGSTSVLIELRRRAAQLDPRLAESAQGPEGQGSAAQGPESQEPGALRTELLCCFLERFADLLGPVEAAARRAPETVSEVLVTMVSQVLSTLGQQVRVELPDGSAERGVAQRLTSQGALQVEVTARRATTEQGWQSCMPEPKAFSAGDVVHLRRFDPFGIRD